MMRALLRVRTQMLRNMLGEQINKFPYLLSALILLPLFLYTAMEFVVPEDLRSMALASRFLDILTAVPRSFAMLVFPLSLLAVPLAIYLHGCYLKSLYQYRSRPIQARLLLCSNLFVALQALAGLIFLLVFFFFQKTQTGLFPLLLVSLLFSLFSQIYVGILVLLNFLVYGLLPNAWLRGRERSVFVLVSLALTALLLVTLVRMGDWFDSAFSVTWLSYVLWPTILGLLLLACLKLRWEPYQDRTTDKKERLFFSRSKIDNRSLYLLTLWDIRQIYRETIGSILILALGFFIVKEHVLLRAEMLIPPMLVLLCVLSNGRIWHFNRFFAHRPKSCLRKLLLQDFICSLLALYFLFGLYALLMGGLSLRALLLWGLLFAGVHLLQCKVQLEIDDGAGQFIFIFTYGLFIMIMGALFA